MSVIVSTIHSNGTSKKELFNGYTAAISAVNKAIEAVRVTAPNARDYYVQEDDRAFEKARGEFEARLKALAFVHGELMEIAVTIHHLEA